MGGAYRTGMERLAPFARRMVLLSPRQIFALGFALTVFIGWLDYQSGAEITLALAYLGPIALVTWYSSLSDALLLSVVCVAFWIGEEYANGVRMSSYWVPVINCAIRLLFYVFLVLAIRQFRHLHRNLERLAGERATLLAAEIAERQKLERAMLTIAEREQRRIGQDLHDSLCQHLTGTALVAQALAERLEARHDKDGVRAHKIVDLVEESIAMARGMAKGLHPVDLEADGLMQAFEEFSAAASELFHVRCRFECPMPVLIHQPATATHLYRIAQEAVSNAVKHGKASEIVILLEENEEGVRLAVSDNGKGLPDPLPVHDGMGLRIMADRARVIGGRFAWGDGKPGGTEIACLVPQAALMEAAHG